MPVTAPETTTPAEKRKPPRRSWRHLPASPPVADQLPLPDAADRLAPPDATEAGGGDDTTVVASSPLAVEPPRKRRRRWLIPAAIVAVLAIVAATVLTLRDDQQPTAASSATTSPGGANAPAPSGSVQDIVKKVSPAVVQLEVGGGIGAGVVFDKAGLILTAHHVVAGIEELTVKLADGTELPGRVVGRLPERDLAVVAVQHDGDLPTADLAGEDTVEVGEAVVAIGSPFGISQTVTSGIVSGLDREIDSPVGKLTGLIQTDAPINPGNSGGPLIDGDAKVIGINSAIASTSGASAGVGFAVPVAEAADLIQQVRDAGGATAPAVPDDSDSSLGGSNPLDGVIPPELRDLLPDGLDDLLNGSGDPMELLQRLLEQLLNGGLQGLDPFAPDQGGNGNGSAPSTVPSQESLSIIDVTSLPDGWTQGHNSVATQETSNGVEGTQDLVLEGPDGRRMAVVAQKGDGAADAFDRLSGDTTEVDGHDAKQLADGGVAWMAADDVLVILKADRDVDQSDADAVAKAIEVA